VAEKHVIAWRNNTEEAMYRKWTKRRNKEKKRKRKESRHIVYIVT
jgi:hypothetical protein